MLPALLSRTGGLTWRRRNSLRAKRSNWRGTAGRWPSGSCESWSGGAWRRDGRTSESGISHCTRRARAVALAFSSTPIKGMERTGISGLFTIPVYGKKSQTPRKGKAKVPPAQVIPNAPTSGSSAPSPLLLPYQCAPCQCPPRVRGRVSAVWCLAIRTTREDGYGRDAFAVKPLFPFPSPIGPYACARPFLRPITGSGKVVPPGSPTAKLLVSDYSRLLDTFHFPKRGETGNPFSGEIQPSVLD